MITVTEQARPRAKESDVVGTEETNLTVMVPLLKRYYLSDVAALQRVKDLLYPSPTWLKKELEIFPCEVGLFLNESHCDKCPKGRYRDVNSVICQECSPGTYNDQKGAA